MSLPDGVASGSGGVASWSLNNIDPVSRKTKIEDPKRVSEGWKLISQNGFILSCTHPSSLARTPGRRRSLIGVTAQDSLSASGFVEKLEQVE
jgi:hypothetical protein